MRLGDPAFLGGANLVPFGYMRRSGAGGDNGSPGARETRAPELAQLKRTVLAGYEPDFGQVIPTFTRVTSDESKLTFVERKTSITAVA